MKFYKDANVYFYCLCLFFRIRYSIPPSVAPSFPSEGNKNSKQLMNEVITSIISYIEGDKIITEKEDNSVIVAVNRKNAAYVTSVMSVLSNGDDESDSITVGSDFSWQKKKKDKKKQREITGIDGHSVNSGSSRDSSPSGRHRIRRNKEPKEPKQSGDRVLYSRSNFQPRKDTDNNIMTIYSVTGCDRGVQTNQLAELSLSVVSSAGNLVEPSLSVDLSQVSFSSSIPEKAEIAAAYAKEEPVAFFPELKVPKSPYSKKTNDIFSDDLVKELTESSNPLVVLYNAYWKYIPSVFRAKLLSTSADKSDAITSHDSMGYLFDPVSKELEKLELSVGTAIKGIDYCSKLTKSLVLIGEHHRLTEDYKKSLNQLLRF